VPPRSEFVNAIGRDGDDVLDGGSARVQLDGSAGVDSALGRGGQDSCRAEKETGCETD